MSCTVKHWKWQLPLFIQCFMYETCRHIENGSKASYINSLFALLGEQRKNNIQSKHNKYEHCDGTFFLVSLLLLLSFMFQGFCPHFFADVTSNSIALDLMNDIVCQTISINVLLYFRFIAIFLFLLNSIQFDVISYLLVLFGCCSAAILTLNEHRNPFGIHACAHIKTPADIQQHRQHVMHQLDMTCTMHKRMHLVNNVHKFYWVHWLHARSFVSVL